MARDGAFSMAGVDTSSPMVANQKDFNGGPSGAELKARGYPSNHEGLTVEVGDFLGSTLIPFDEARVEEYIYRTDDRNEWYTTGNNPYGAPVAPACLLPSHDSIEISTWWMPNMHGNLHAKQQWEFFAPVMVGQTVLASRTFADKYQKRGRLYTVAEVLFTDPNTGRLFAKQRHHQSFVEAQTEEAIEAWNTNTSDKSQGTVIKKDRERMPNPGEVGEHVELFGPVRHDVDQDLCERFAGSKAGDGFGNGHLDIDEAKAMGFPGIVTVGVLSVAFLAELMTQRFGRGFFEGGTLDLKLVRPLWMGQVCEAWGVVREWQVDPNGKTRRKAICEIWTSDEEGTVTIVGDATAYEALDEKAKL
eukprot:COSAG06_NODE_129_length_22602_cov_7.116318_5_plen_360_part_00